ncbi:DUF4901 domain-containing protein [Bacillus sonorensis]|uniref:YcdB/YcdC repeated domain-containing protein n=1 Tax=Bacillus sonorensis TaxID=119858 RepID=A0ABN5ANP3_9BACI|nr:MULTISPECIES: YcdB/YcdC domain-containing protein [Bacillus]ASB91188.1 uncharacterized protein S101395_04700 [Bacillus sonorensis]MCF7619973.1 DUF4901 domain-containing protein [Bacillus sonorensis]MCY7857087.1 DUF4901 domain-containing protein [Bacillus sonorensis]MCY8027359.1 DUF4901 domain-containing protein [Bacillus sonorensis]MCY8034586.1 DUF4901 domain-containing protein [Bacillus sonorensis]
MNSEQLKQKAHRIGSIPSHYRLMIEECRNEQQGRALYVWADAEHQERDIAVELDHDGRLISLTKENFPFEKQTLPEEVLQQKAFQFVEYHYPDAVKEFVFQGKKVKEHAVQYTYAQTVLDLPLPQTGFSVTIGKSGEVIEFRYDGGTSSYALPTQMVDKESVISRYLDSIELNLVIEHIHHGMYEGGDDQPHLVYEAVLPKYSYPADLSEECDLAKAEVYEDDEETIPLPLLTEPERNETMDINDMIGFDPSLFRKIRETDFGTSIGTVWRKGEEPEPAGNDLAGYIAKRSQNTLKVITVKKTGKLRGVASFIKETGPAVWPEEACLKRAIQFLFRLYPRADRFFRMYPLDNTEEKQIAFFQFNLAYEGVPLRLGIANISINRTNGRVVGFQAPDIDPESLETLNPSPDISAEQANAIFASAFDLKLQWQKDCKRDENDAYRLVYRPVCPAFIDAHKGTVFRRRT